MRFFKRILQAWHARRAERRFECLRKAGFIALVFLAVPTVAKAQDASIFVQGRFATVLDVAGENMFRYTGLEVACVGRFCLDVFHISSRAFYVFEPTASVATHWKGMRIAPGLAASWNKFQNRRVGPNVNLSIGVLRIPLFRYLFATTPEGRSEWAVIVEIVPGKKFRGRFQTFGDVWEIQAGSVLTRKFGAVLEVRAIYNANGAGVESRISWTL